MKDNEDNIQFDTMPDLDWGWGGKQKTQNVIIEKDYDSLYDELVDKCSPSKFPIESVGLEKFNIANDIYAQLLECKRIAESMGKSMVSDDSLKILRDIAIDELDVHISTRKLFTKLKSVFEPNQFINRQPYDKELVEKAGKWYDLLLKSEDDIRALERIEQDSEAFAFLQIAMDDSDFKSLTAQEYLERHPNGTHKQEALSRIENVANEALKKEEDYFKNASAENYLSEYPQGRHYREARYYLDNHWWSYLKKYPEGRYVDDAKGVRAGIIFILFVFVSIAIAITVSSTQ